MVFLKLNVSGSKYFLFDYRSCFESKSFDTIFFFFSWIVLSFSCTKTHAHRMYETATPTTPIVSLSVSIAWTFRIEPNATDIVVIVVAFGYFFFFVLSFSFVKPFFLNEIIHISGSNSNKQTKPNQKATTKNQTKPMGILYAHYTYVMLEKYAWKSKMCVASQHTDNMRKNNQPTYKIKYNSKKMKKKKNVKCLSQSGFTCRRCLVCCVFVASFLCIALHCKTIHCTAPVPVHSSRSCVRCAFELCLFSSFGLFKKKHTHI